MKRSIQSRIAIAVLAIGTLAAAAGANAATNVYFSVSVPAVSPGYGPPPVHGHAQPVYVPHSPTVHVPSRPVYHAPPAYAHEGRYGRERGWRSACRAPAWDPHVRYMPGQTVWRKGNLYMATRLSARVWNENSPPEWTPNYWVTASCV